MANPQSDPIRAPKPLTKTVGNLRYSTAKATLLAHNDVAGRAHYEHRTYLFKTASNRYFKQTESDRTDGTILPMKLDEAMSLYRALDQKVVLTGEAFPDELFEDA